MALMGYCKKRTEGHTQCVISKLILRKGFTHPSVRLQRGLVAFTRATGGLLGLRDFPFTSRFLPR